jgi:TonB-linked SusC/RagA family outer membrane protein
MPKKTILRMYATAALLFASLQMFAQGILINGTVISGSDNEAVIGGTVKEKGTKNATITDLDGHFSIKVSKKDAELEFSYIGFVTKTVPSSAGMKVTLNENAQSLKEVVVTGYMAEKKADLTGSVSVVKMKDVADIPTGNVLSGLQGRVSGMNITTDGTPGGTNTSTLVRGKSSFRDGANSPLYVIDGVMTRENISSILSANDVESIQVLKDAASAAIYGAQAANGVIIITTKHAKKGEIRVNVDASLTAQTYTCGFDMLNADQWGEVYWQAYKYANNGNTPSSEVYGTGSTPKLQDYVGLNNVLVHAQDTNWRDVIYQTAWMQNYNLNLSKGSDNGSTTLTLNYLDHKGLVKFTEFKRFNTRLASDYKFLNNRLRIGENIAVNYWTQTLEDSGVNEGVIKQHPAKTVYDSEGNYNDAIGDVLGDAPNYLRLQENQKNNSHEYWRIFGNAFVEIEPIKNLVLRSNFGINYYNENNKVWEPKWARDQVNKLTQSQARQTDWVWTNTANYNIDFGKNSLTALLGVEAKKYVNKTESGYGTNLAIEDKNYIYLDAVTSGQTVNANASYYSMISFFGKVNYSYDEKYLLSATVRRDASSRLSKDNNAGVFPSFSAGWRISKENFMKNTSSWLDELKLRASWGINGNDIIANDAFYNKYLVSLKDASYNLTGDGSTLAAGAYKTRSTNPDLTWETTTQTNFGIDASFLKSRLNVSLDYFYKKTKDMLVERPYIAVIGEGGYAWYNGGSMENKGIEGAVTWRDHVKDFNYEASFNLSYYKNKVTGLSEDIYYTYGGGNGVDKTLVGQPFGSWFGFKTDGIFHSQKEVDEYKSKYGVEFGAPGIGRIKYVDANGDGKINTNDRTWLGSDNPKFIGGLNLSCSYKGFDISMFFNGMIRDAYNNSKYYTDLFQCWTGNHSTRLLDAVQAYKDFETTGYYNCSTPAVTTLNTNNENQVSEFYIEDGSYIKMKSLTVGYTLPTSILNKLSLRSARVYLQAQNLFTITGYTGADPEGLGYAYPLPRTFSFGVSFGF